MTGVDIFAGDPGDERGIDRGTPWERVRVLVSAVNPVGNEGGFEKK